MNINFLVRLPLRQSNWVCPSDAQFVPGTNPGFLLALHSGSPVRTNQGRRETEQAYVLKVDVPFSLASIGVLWGLSLLPRSYRLVTKS